MTRMSREFSLVLLGAGALTAGYFLWPEKDFEKQAEDQSRQRVGGRTHMPILLLGHVGGTRAMAGGARSPAMGGVSTRGFGSIGGRVSGGG